MSDRERLVYISAGYPYGRGEKTFVEPEIRALREYFEITIVSLANQDHLADTENISDIPDDIRLVLSPPSKPLRAGIDALSMFLSPVGWQELRALATDGMSFGRLRDSMWSFSRGKSVLRTLCKEKLLVRHNTQPALFYSFWFNNALIAFALARRQSFCFRLCARTNGADLYNERNAHSRQPFQRIKRDVCTNVLFCASRPFREFVKEFGEEHHRGQYVLNRLGVTGFPIQPVFLPPERTSNTERIIVSCSSVIPIKRIMLIAQSMALFDDAHPIRWIHFGDGPELKSIQAYAREHGIRAEFKGHVANEVITRYYRSHFIDAFISVSSTEGGCPVSIQEALSACIPIVGTDVGGIPDTIRNNGVLLPANPTPQQVKEALESIVFASRERVSALRKASLELWQERFDQTNTKRELVRILLG